MRSTFSLFLVVICVASVVGCMGRGDPVVPGGDRAEGFSRGGLSPVGVAALSAEVSQGSSVGEAGDFPHFPGHAVWGLRRVRLWEDGRVEVFPLRTEEAHFDVTGVILGCLLYTSDAADE